MWNYLINNMKVSTPLLVIIIWTILLAIILQFILYYPPDLAKNFLENVGSYSEEMGPIITVFFFIVYGLIFFIFFSSIFLIFRHNIKKNRALKKSGIRRFVKIEKVESERIETEDGTFEHKNVYITTPLGAKGLFRFPIDTDVNEGDELQIVYDLSNASYFNLGYNNGKPVIKKTQDQDYLNNS